MIIEGSLVEVTVTIKIDSVLVALAIRCCLSESGITVSDLAKMIGWPEEDLEKALDYDHPNQEGLQIKLVKSVEEIAKALKIPVYDLIS